MAATGRMPPSALAEVIVRAHLFGEAAVASDARGSDPTPEARDWRLAGTLATANPTEGIAILGPEGQLARAYRAGVEIAAGIWLREVYPDHVQIERNGQMQSLMLPRSSLTLFAQQTAVLADREIEPPEHPEELRTVITAESDRLAAVMRLEPLMSGDLVSGIVVQPGADPGMLRRLGLEPGDVVSNVDGILVTREDRVEVLRKALGSGRSIQLAITRPPGDHRTVTVDTSALSGLISN